MIKKILHLLFLGIPVCVHAQGLDLENLIDGKPVQVNGYLSANGVYYNSNQNNAREPFTYFLQGGVNIRLYSFAIPISYSFTNQGQGLDYKLPFDFNRLSLHPSYKWITAHIGDVSMSFSPYTLNGHQFTGGGVELGPKGKFKISAMYGRLLRATEEDGDPQTVPAFERIGQGIKTTYKERKYSIGVIAFYAKDRLNSIPAVPEEKGVFPKENLVLSVEGTYKITNELDLMALYASSAITQDLRAKETKGGGGNGLAGLFFNGLASTEHYKALKAGLNYRIDQSTFGVGYERIDPGYETLGAYYFNNDFENISLSATTVLFSNVLNLAFDIGYQRDDLKGQKDNATSRTVGAVNASANLNEKWSLTGSYSNFKTFTNIKVNQFDAINDDNLLDDRLDTLNYRQLSQSATLGINYILSKKEDRQQSINLNYAVNDVANEQGGVVRIGDASIFHNLNTSYTSTFPERQLSITGTLNGTYNTIGREDATTWGPTISVNKQFFDRTLGTGLSASYNVTHNKAGEVSMANIRAKASYVLLERHHLNLSIIQLFRGGPQDRTVGLSELTATLGYTYAFDLPPKLKGKKGDKGFSFSYKGHYFEGMHDAITPQVVAVSRSGRFSGILEIKGIISNLSFYEEVMLRSEDKKDREYQQAAMDYLKYLYDHNDFLDTYNDLAFKSLGKLYTEAVAVDDKVGKDYILAAAKVNSAKTKNREDLENLEVKENGYFAHKWMMGQLRHLHFDDIVNNKGLLKGFRDSQISKVFTMLENGKTNGEIQDYLEVQFADLYHKKALEIKAGKP